MGCDGFLPKVPLDLSNDMRREVVKFFEKVEQCGKWPQQACMTMFFFFFCRFRRTSSSVPSRICAL